MVQIVKEVVFSLQLEYLAVYGRASMGVPVSELQYGL